MDSDSLPPASSSNSARQQRSRRNDTHPIRWQDADLEHVYNVDRSGKGGASGLKRLHRKSTPGGEGDDVRS